MIAGFGEIAPSILAVVISFLAILQKSDDRIIAGSIFAVTGLGHIVMLYSFELVFVGGMDGVTYFVTASVASVIAMELMYRIPEITGLSVTLQRICMAEIITNAISLALWYNSIYPEVNTYAFVALRAWVIVALIKRDNSHDMGGYEATTRGGYFMRVVNPWGCASVIHDKREGGAA